MADAPPPNTPTRTVLRCGSGFYRITPENPWRRKSLFEIRYGHRILSFFPFWICFAILAGHIPVFTRCILPFVEASVWRTVYGVLMGLTMVSYLATHFLDPGMLPWTWSETQKRKYSSQEFRDGIASTEEQFVWAYGHQQPARAAFSRRYGFFVLRGDHDCWWVNNFVGINNQRYFLLSLLFSSLLTVYTDVIGLGVLANHRHEMTKKVIWTAVLYHIPSTWMGCVAIFQLYSQVRNVTKNVTLFELIASQADMVQPVWDRGCFNNWEEVCGSRWFLPCGKGSPAPQ